MATSENMLATGSIAAACLRRQPADTQDAGHYDISRMHTTHAFLHLLMPPLTPP